MRATATLRSRLWWGFAALIPAVALATALALNIGVHPKSSRQAVIDAALEGYSRQSFPRVVAKLMHRRDLDRADPSRGSSGDENQLIWVVAISGDYGIAPSFGCCSVPSDYRGKNTWGVAIIPDAAGTPKVAEFESSYHGVWPPYFDSLPDLASGI